MMAKAPNAELDPRVAGADSAELLVMVYDRLVLDVQRGLEAQRRGDLEETVRQLTHARDIVTELQQNLTVDAFKGGYDLAALYEFLNRRLVMASIGKDTAITDECLTLVTDLCVAWRHAAYAGASEPASRHRSA
jgi:flagellar protein FliS